MSSKTLEHLFKQTEANIRVPLDAWTQLRRARRNYRPKDRAFAKQSLLNLDLLASRH